MLRMMAKALEESKKDKEFEENEGGASGGGGGGGGPPQMIPPVADLKLLRGVQVLLKTETEGLAQALPDLSESEARSEMLEIAAQQRELGALGEAMMEKAKKSVRPPEAPETPEVAPQVTPVPDAPNAGEAQGEPQ